MPPGKQQVESPFLKEQPVRLGFNIMMLLLLMVVAAGVGLFLVMAMRVPAITNELNAWLGRPGEASQVDGARKAQLNFALYLYAAPTLMGMLAYALHYIVNAVDKRMKKVQESSEDKEFQME